MSAEVTDELKRLALILADWAAPAPHTTIYLYGSRVRGDHRPNSDVDIHVHFGSPAKDDVEWWQANNNEEFKTINARLPGRLEVLEQGDPLAFDIRLAKRVHVDRNVVCVWRPSVK